MLFLLAAGCRSSSDLPCATKTCRDKGKLPKVSEDKAVNVVSNLLLLLFTFLSNRTSSVGHLFAGTKIIFNYSCSVIK